MVKDGAKARFIAAITAVGYSRIVSVFIPNLRQMNTLHPASGLSFTPLPSSTILSPARRMKEGEMSVEKEMENIKRGGA